MTPRIAHDRKGGEDVLVYTCVPCGYDFKASMVRANGECKPIGSLDTKGPEEGLLGHAK